MGHRMKIERGWKWSKRWNIIIYLIQAPMKCSIVIKKVNMIKIISNPLF